MGRKMLFRNACIINDLGKLLDLAEKKRMDKWQKKGAEWPQKSRDAKFFRDAGNYFFKPISLSRSSRYSPAVISSYALGCFASIQLGRQARLILLLGWRKKGIE